MKKMKQAAQAVARLTTYRPLVTSLFDCKRALESVGVAG